MFNLVPVTRYRGNRRNLTEREDRFDSLWSNMFDMADTFRTDVKETEDQYTIQAEIPGVDKKNISVELDDNHLIITVNNEETVEDKESDYIRKERRSGTYCRSFYIENVNEDEIEANYDSGILEISLPKASPVQAGKRVVDVK